MAIISWVLVVLLFLAGVFCIVRSLYLLCAYKDKNKK